VKRSQWLYLPSPESIRLYEPFAQQVNSPFGTVVTPETSNDAMQSLPRIIYQRGRSYETSEFVVRADNSRASQEHRSSRGSRFYLESRSVWRCGHWLQFLTKCRGRSYTTQHIAIEYVFLLFSSFLLSSSHSY